MVKLLRILLISFLFLWELPQNLLGMIILVIMKNNSKVVKTEKRGSRYFIETLKTGVSLGWFVFWTPAGNRFQQYRNDCLMHEYGHARQSIRLGPAYLFIVGIPSLTRVAYSRYYFIKHGKRWSNYFNGFPENWADKLGGINNP